MQDVVQTVWLRLAEHGVKIRQPDRLASWLATTTRHEALRVIRGNTRQTPQAMSDDFAEPTAPRSRSGGRRRHAPRRAAGLRRVSRRTSS